MKTTETNTVQYTEGELEIREWADESIDLKLKGDIIHYIAQINKQDKYGEAKANAEHIVRCWNSHQKLKTAAHNALIALEALNDYLQSNRTVNGFALQTIEELKAVIKATEQ